MIGPLILPGDWKEIESPTTDPGSAFAHKDGLFVILTEAVELDGKYWRHMSISHRGRLPTWRELRDAKDIFLGVEALAYQILPPASEYVNLHPNVLHLWTCLNGRPTPDFRRGRNQI